MSDGVFYAYLGALVLSAIVLAVVAARGSGQGRVARLLSAVIAAGFLGYAVYLAVANPSTVHVFFYAFILPVLAVLNLVRSRRRRPGGPVPAPLPYGGEAGLDQTGFGAPQPGSGAAGSEAVGGFPAAAGFGAPAQAGGFPQQAVRAPQPGFPAAGSPQTGFAQAGFAQAGSPAQPGFAQHGFPQRGFPSQPGEGHPQLAGLPQQSGLAPQPGGFPQQPGEVRQQPAGFPPTGGPAPRPGGFPAAGVPQEPGRFAAGQPLSPAAPTSSAPGGFQSAAALFAPPPQPGSPAPAVDPGTYARMPSGLAGDHGPDHEMPSARPSGLPAGGLEPVSAALADPSTRPSGLPQRPAPVGADSEFAAPPSHDPQPAHIEFTQRLTLPEPLVIRDVPAGPQPLYPQHPAPAKPFESTATQQFRRPAFEQPPVAQPEYQNQDHPQPGSYDQDYARPGLQTQGHPQPGFQDQGHPQPGFQNRGEPQPGFEDQGEPRPGFPGQGYAQPGHMGDAELGYSDVALSRAGLPEQRGYEHPQHTQHGYQDESPAQHEYQGGDHGRREYRDHGHQQHEYQEADHARREFRDLSHAQHGYQPGDPETGYETPSQVSGEGEVGYSAPAPAPRAVDNGYQAHGHHAAHDQRGRHEVDGQPFGQPAYEVPSMAAEAGGDEPGGYYPAHGEQRADGGGSPAYAQELGRHERPEPHPAEWPPLRG